MSRYLTLTCTISRAAQGVPIKVASGVVTFVTEDSCTVEVRQYFSGQTVKPGDSLVLDPAQWKGD